MAGGTKILIGACLLTVFLAKNGAAAFIPHADLTGKPFVLSNVLVLPPHPSPPSLPYPCRPQPST
jgi:hypothetical protein